MKPNDKAIEAAFAAAEAHIGNTSQREWLREILTAAYAAQFQSKDYAGLVKQLRFIDEDTLNIEPYSCEQLCKSAADAIEALLAERDASREQLKYFGELHRQEYDRICTERDALAAHLAPVDDDILREIAAMHFARIDGHSDNWDRYVDEAKDYIDAIRPHIEAVERERCAHEADKRKVDADDYGAHLCEEIAAAIRSGSGK